MATKTDLVWRYRPTGKEKHLIELPDARAICGLPHNDVKAWLGRSAEQIVMLAVMPSCRQCMRRLAER